MGLSIKDFGLKEEWWTIEVSVPSRGNGVIDSLTSKRSGGPSKPVSVPSRGNGVIDHRRVVERVTPG